MGVTRCRRCVGALSEQPCGYEHDIVGDVVLWNVGGGSDGLGKVRHSVRAGLVPSSSWQAGRGTAWYETRHGRRGGANWNTGCTAAYQLEMLIASQVGKAQLASWVETLDGQEAATAALSARLDSLRTLGGARVRASREGRRCGQLAGRCREPDTAHKVCPLRLGVRRARARLAQRLMGRRAAPRASPLIFDSFADASAVDGGFAGLCRGAHPLAA